MTNPKHGWRSNQKNVRMPLQDCYVMVFGYIFRIILIMLRNVTETLETAKYCELLKEVYFKKIFVLIIMLIKMKMHIHQCKCNEKRW